MNHWTKHDPYRTFRQAICAILIPLLLFFLIGLFNTADAHDPNGPEYWPRNMDWSAINAGLDENFNSLSESEAFIFLGLTVTTCLIIALPKIFDGTYRTHFEYKCTHFENTGDLCIRLRLFSYDF